MNFSIFSWHFCISWNQIFQVENLQSSAKITDLCIGILQGCHNMTLPSWCAHSSYLVYWNLATWGLWRAHSSALSARQTPGVWCVCQGGLQKKVPRMRYYSRPAPNFGYVPHSWALPTSELIISLNIGSSQGNRSGRGLTGLRHKI